MFQKICTNINTASCVRPQLLSTECDRRNLLLTIIVGCADNTCKWYHCDAEVEQEAIQLLIAVARFLFECTLTSCSRTDSAISLDLHMKSNSRTSADTCH